MIADPNARYYGIDFELRDHSCPALMRDSAARGLKTGCSTQQIRSPVRLFSPRLQRWRRASDD